ncbi:probable glutathione S-transferase [Pistacia vera]|uniref:probable glutathione S-transferase n=1 Tax=Pistacia vera TaxID=55513 RepID=UPI001263352D|nr:probable glutathione S-transferase [Pistacia vera]
MGEEVKLIGMWASIFCQRIQMALKLKRIQFEYIEEDLSNKSPLLLQYNPIHKKVPVLVHNGKSISESLAIFEYIDETWKHNPIMPEDPYDRAMARFWAKFIDEKLLWTVFEAFTSKENELEKAIDEASLQLKFFENQLKDKSFFGGDTIGYLDIVGIVVAHWFGIMQEVLEVELINEEKFPILHNWIVKFLDIAMVQESLPPREKLLAHTRKAFRK